MPYTLEISVLKSVCASIGNSAFVLQLQYFKNSKTPFIFKCRITLIKALQEKSTLSLLVIHTNILTHLNFRNLKLLGKILLRIDDIGFL